MMEVKQQEQQEQQEQEEQEVVCEAYPKRGGTDHRSAIVPALPRVGTRKPTRYATLHSSCEEEQSGNSMLHKLGSWCPKQPTKEREREREREREMICIGGAKYIHQGQ